MHPPAAGGKKATVAASRKYARGMQAAAQLQRLAAAEDASDGEDAELTTASLLQQQEQADRCAAGLGCKCTQQICKAGFWLRSCVYRGVRPPFVAQTPSCACLRQHVWQKCSKTCLFLSNTLTLCAFQVHCQLPVAAWRVGQVAEDGAAAGGSAGAGGGGSGRAAAQAGARTQR